MAFIREHVLLLVLIFACVVTFLWLLCPCCMWCMELPA